MTGLRKFVMTGVLGLIGLVGTNGAALASDHCCYKYVTTYECVVCYETRSEAYQKTFTYYDNCGKPYCVTKTCYHDVPVAIKKYVPVVRKVACY